VECRTAVVTGASAGLGAAIAEALARLGFKVAIGARRLERLDEVAKSIRDEGGDVFAHELDVTDPESVDRFFAAVEATFGSVDVAVSNAGVCVPGLLHEVTPEDLQAEVLTNLLGPMYMARRCIPSMTRSAIGDVVFISSDNARAPRTFQAAYSAAKTGVEALARTLAMELEGTGVRVSTIRMGPIATDFGRGWDGKLLKRMLASWKRFGLQRNLVFMDPEVVAAAVVSAVTAPRGTYVATIELQPEGPPEP
jgi:NAD(P)-dependent dehydrogenase (short-subunit alcohol dehydrogenase family)